MIRSVLILMVLILAARTGGGDATAGAVMTPWGRAVSTPEGQLKSPYADFASVAEEVGLLGSRLVSPRGPRGGPSRSRGLGGADRTLAAEHSRVWSRNTSKSLQEYRRK